MTRNLPPAAVLFDCDGVLADSEAVVNALVAEDLTARGWPLTQLQARETFLGMAIPTMLPVIESRLGRMPPDWAQGIANRISTMMRASTPQIPGAVAALRRIVAAGIPVACASNSGREELQAKLEGLGVADLFGPRRFSFQDVARPKPAPDMYLAAAAACGVAPEDCVVIEDSLLGATAGIAAGCRVFGFTHETEPSVLQAVGAVTFGDMDQLPGLLGIK